jgi:signal transduction histidine kinase
MAAHRVSLRLALDEALPPVLANRIQIQRVLVNLLTNAIESLGAAERRGRRISIRSAAGDHETLRLEISDSGAGIAPEDMTQIFEPFFTTKASGTGLGLSLSRTVVESHGGRLWATRAEDGGATFHLELRHIPRSMRASGARAEATTV